jgi:hypothetical protein
MTKRLSQIGALSAGLFAAAAALQAEPALAGKKEQKAFDEAGYNLCDARLLAIYWNTDAEDAINEAGDKLIRGDKQTVVDALNGGRKENNGNIVLCPAKEFYSAKEIEAFAEYWDLGRKAAERSISEKLITGQKESIDDAIKEQLAGG